MDVKGDLLRNDIPKSYLESRDFELLMQKTYLRSLYLRPSPDVNDSVSVSKYILDDEKKMSLL